MTDDIRHTDYSSELPDLDFGYDEKFYPLDKDLPDPQINPVIPGSKVPLQKVGIGPVSIPLILTRRDGTEQILQSKASLYGSLDDPLSKGLNLSRFYMLLHRATENTLTMNDMKGILDEMKEKQNCSNAYLKFRFSYPWTQKALRTRKDLPVLKQGDDWANYPEIAQRLSDGSYINVEKEVGHIFYNTELECQKIENEYKFFLTVKYVYSSTCPCSFTLANNATTTRGKAANGHSQRSIAKIKIQFDPNNVIWIEDIVELARRQLPTEVVVVCKRRDEMAFSEINGSNLVFTEDSSRLLYEGLDQWFDEGKIQDFSIVTDHLESLHPWEATAVCYKGIKNGLR